MKEPRIEKDFEAHGLRCLVIAQPMGHRCGYVGLPKGHALYGFSGEHLEDCHSLRVHGGITYCGNRGGYPLENSDLWWLGFDCAHHGDARDLSLMDETTASYYRGNPLFKKKAWETIKDATYVEAELRQLAEQIAQREAGITDGN